MGDEQGFIEEYKSLREELTKKQDARLLVLAFTVAAVSTIVGLTLKEGTPGALGLDYQGFAFIGIALVTVMASLMLTIHHTQHIDIIAGYIKKFIEPNVKGIHWETRFGRYREACKSNPQAGGVPLGTSKPLALYYGFLTVAVYSMSFVIGLQNHAVALGIVSILAIGSLACSADLYMRKTSGWRVNWNKIDQHDSSVDSKPE